MEDIKFPQLRLTEWKATRDTLHKYCKMLGAIREKMSDPQTHWWHISLRVGENELTTLPLYKSKQEKDKTIELKLDFIHRKLLIVSSYRETMYIALTGQSLSALCDETCSLLSDIGITSPVEKPSFIDGKPGTFEPGALQNYWTALKKINAVFKEFKSTIGGKTSPVQLWPHHFDLAVNWFSGRLIPGKDPANPEESEEQMTFGFSTGDDTIPDAYFYATAYPAPNNMLSTNLPENSYWNKSGFVGAVMMFNSIVEADDGLVRLLEFLKSVHSSVSELMVGNT